MKNLNISTNGHYILGKSIFSIFLLIFICLFLTHCSNNSTAPSLKGSLITDTISDKYISDKDPLSSCWYTNLGKDSLLLNGKHYVISNRSRYRKFEEPVDFGDTIAEGAVLIYDPIAFLHDTKTDSNFIFNSCQKL
jgi:hypothetical protein